MRPPRSCPATEKRPNLSCSMTVTMSWAMDRFAYGSWSRAEAGQPLRPWPRRSAQTTVKLRTSSGATERHIKCVCGKPCNKRIGGPDPYERTKMLVSPVWISDVVNLSILQLIDRLADSKEIALAVPEPGGLLANAPLARVVPGNLGDVVDRPQARKVVFLEHHSTRSQPLHRRLDVFDLPRHLGVIS